jgi:hypothetical protein
MAESDIPVEKIATIEPFDMPEKEREIVSEVTTLECGKNCKHCKHTEACDIKLHFRTRYCATCRVYVFRRMQEWIAIQYERKKAKGKARMNSCQPVVCFIQCQRLTSTFM